MLRIQTLGGLTVRLDDGRLPAAAAIQPRRLALLALLGRAGEQGITRDKAVALLWADADEEAGRRGLTQALYGLRTGLDAEQIVVGVQELRLNREVARCDVLDFEEALAGGEYERAASVYKGPFLDGFRVPNAPEFERWVDEARAELARTYAELLERLGRRTMERGDAIAAAGWWRRRAGCDPLDSRVALELMRALVGGGDRAGALQHARIHTTLVEQELGLAPSPELLAFAEALRRNDAPPPIGTSTTAGSQSLIGAPGAGGAPVTPPPSTPLPVPSSSAAAQELGVAGTSPAPIAAARAAPRRARWMVAGGIVGAGLVLALAMRRDRGEAGDPLLRSLRVSAPQHVTNDEGLELDPAISPDGKSVAYAAGFDGAMRIFVRQREGSRAVPVSAALGGDHRHPRWSPDGTHLIFQADRGIWRAPALGGAPRLVVEPPDDTLAAARSATWSPDGEQVAWVVRDTVLARPIDGGGPRVVAVLRDAHSLAWSPDGRWIAAVAGNSEFVYGPVVGNLGPSALYLLPAACDRGTSCPPTLLAPPTSLNVSPAWLDASRLVFVSNRGGARDLFAASVDAAGAVHEPLRLSAGQELHSVSAAADGGTLAYGVFRQSTNIWSLPITPGRPRPLAEATRVTSGRQTIEGMDVSSDGRWLAFDANRTGQQDIYVVPTTGGEPQPVVATPQDDFHPTWSPDGKWLAFYTFRDGIRRAAIVPSRGGPIRLVHPDGPVREEHTPVWTRDGQGLVYFRMFTDETQLFAVRRTSDSTWSAETQVTRQGGVAPSFSADGARMAYFAAPSLVKVMGPDLDEASSRLVHGPPAPGSDAVRALSGFITPEGTSFIMKGEDRTGRGFWSVPITGGTPRLLVRLEDPQRTSPRPEFASDGKRLFFTLTEREADVWAVRLEER